MQLSPRHFPLFRSFKFASYALFAFLAFTHIVDTPVTRAIAPVVEASAIMAAEDFLPADLPSSGDRELDKIIYRAGERHGVDPRLLHAVIWQESKYKPKAVSHAGARGMMQLMPDTARRFKCDDANNPEANIEAGTKYLRWLLKRFNGDVVMALAGYNAGEGNVDKYDGVPPFDETQKYVRIITGRYGKTYHPLLSPDEARAHFRLLPEIAQAN
ncbi:MAG TPA: lytic transglycosylase domain-containing protein [Pyrinomonadaceae bacterium]|nr:lytic transglycosylase domain-containing protein [Pyrinomonadaceae bacterium]